MQDGGVEKMKIDKNNLPLGLWWEDKDGNRIQCDGRASAPSIAITAHKCFPLEIRTEHYRLHDYENPDGRTSRTYHGSDRVLTTSCHIGGGNEPIILAMANSGDYTLSEALCIYAHCCERCANVLAHKYLNGADGYPEFSDEWKKCGTVCEFCKDGGFESRSADDPILPLEVEQND
jgi:hypothetical protein